MRLPIERAAGAALLAVLVTACASAGQQGPMRTPVAEGGVATSSAITEADLRARLSAFAHDSMAGREAGTPGHDRATEYLARELARIGLEPAGYAGTYFQAVPLFRLEVDESATSLRVGGRSLEVFRDFVPLYSGSLRADLANAPVVYGGELGDPASLIPAEEMAGKVVVVARVPGPPPLAVPYTGQGSPFAAAAAVVLSNVEPSRFQGLADYLRISTMDTVRAEAGDPQPPVLVLTGEAVAALFAGAGGPLRAGTAGLPVSGSIAFDERPAPSRNVVAILPGSDPRLRGEYVALGAHSDHDGIRSVPLHHDSIRAVNFGAARLERELGRPAAEAEREALERQARPATQTERAGRDSVFNGADDDASGSMALLEIAEWAASARERLGRSLLFVWHTAEEKGLHGSAHFTAHPTVPRDRIIAQINVDMIGRGGADQPFRAADHLEVIGSRRLSTALGDLVETANRERAQPFQLDYTLDAAGHPENVYCRSDHANYARFGIPVVFFSTGDHPDYHQLTDEPQYLDYTVLARVTDFVADVALRLANLPSRPLVDRPVPRLDAPCRQ